MGDDLKRTKMTTIRNQHIAAGQFKAGTGQECVFQAFLGTCLGVALYAPKKKIGGMIHILLPHPLGSLHPPHPEKYAATGVPLLIQAIEKLGAEPEELEATVAGGALMGPVAPEDMGLDIGGRSADIAMGLLEDAGIPVKASETGGFFTCTLELDMATGATRINPAWEIPCTDRHRLPPMDLDHIQATIQALKPIPQTALKILRMSQENRYDIGDITHELARDQVLSGQTLKLCNSALFSGSIHIDSLKDAVLLLGESMLIKSVITASVASYYDQTGTSGYSLCRGGLFFHAVGVATTAEHIAQKTGKAQDQMAYTAGLLHDIGKVILDQHIAGQAPLLFRDFCQGGMALTEMEQKRLGISHCDAGAILAATWHFSPALTQVIRYHHQPEKADTETDLAHIIYLADLLMERFHTGVDMNKTQTHSMAAALDRLGLTMADIPALMDSLPLNDLQTSDIIIDDRNANDPIS